MVIETEERKGTPRRERKKRQVKHIPSPMAWDESSRKWLPYNKETKSWEELKEVV